MAIAYGFLSTYPPTQCGLATFSSALLRHLTVLKPGSWGRVVRVLDRPQRSGSSEVVHHLVNGSPGAARHAAAALNQFDVAVVQHEYGIYGGRDGAEVLEIMANLRVPAIVVLHTVLASPSSHQRRVLSEVVGRADAVVTMSDTAARRLLGGYTVEPHKVLVIPHGAAVDHNTGRNAAIRSRTARPMILTWGLIGPGKGIRWAITAITGLRDLTPMPRYVVAGQTHPRVLERDGEAYRNGLRAQVAEAGVADLVEFDPAYRNTRALTDLVRRAAVVLLPYESSEQVTSGVLIEAVAAGRPVVATRFPHACDLLADGAGLLVPHQDAHAIGAALRRILTEPGLAASMTAKAAQLAPVLGWPAVASRYRDLAVDLLAARTPVAL